MEACSPERRPALRRLSGERRAWQTNSYAEDTVRSRRGFVEGDAPPRTERGEPWLVFELNLGRGVPADILRLTPGLTALGATSTAGRRVQVPVSLPSLCVSDLSLGSAGRELRGFKGPAWFGEVRLSRVGPGVFGS